jgi:ribosomal protein L7/L12
MPDYMIVNMTSPQQLYQDVLKSTGDKIAAIRAIRLQFNLNLHQAKEITLQAEGVAQTLDEHEGRFVEEVEKYFDSKANLTKQQNG